MSREQLKTYLDAQVNEINKYFNEEHSRRSITLDQAAMEWIKQNGATFHASWSRGVGVETPSRARFPIQAVG